MEPWIELNLQMDSLGHIIVTGEAWDQLGTGNKLKFHLPELDQTYIPTWLEELDRVIEWMG